MCLQSIALMSAQEATYRFAVAALLVLVLLFVQRAQDKAKHCLSTLTLARVCREVKPGTLPVPGGPCSRRRRVLHVCILRFGLRLVVKLGVPARD